MLKTVNEVRSQISPNLQKLLNDSLLESDDPRPLMFGDEQEFKTIKGKPFHAEINACFSPVKNRFIIFLKQIDKIGSKEECDISHEIVHLWLLLLGLPSEKESTNRDRQAAWDTFFGPLREIMEHAVYYPLIKNIYQINLYKIGTERLDHFIKSQLPSLKNESEPEKLLLLLNYIKYEVESDDHYALEGLHNAYSKKALDVKNVADILLPVVRKLASIKDAQFFIAQYRKILKIIGTNFCIPENLWPNFVTQINTFRL
jgi:hypothetical protein